MSKALALLSLTVLSSVCAAEIPRPSWTNHNRIAGSQQMMTNFKPWAEAVGSTIGDKRDKDDLAVYEVMRTENTDLKLTTNVVDRLATTNGVAEAISANEKTGTNEQVVRGELWQDSMWLIEVENADFARLALADEEGHNIIDTYATKSEVDDKADRATTLSGYGITDGVTKTEVVPLWVAGNIYNAGDIVLYDGAYYRAMFDDTSSSPDKTFSYWEPITFENVDVYGGLSVHTGDLSVDNGDLELSGGGITVNSGFEIKRGINKVVYGISVNGGAAQHGDVSIDVPTPGNYSAVSNAAMWASNEVASIHISAANPTFSSAVLAVGLNIDTNSVAVLNEIASTFGGFPIEGTATTVGGLLAAIAAAIAWLKKNKVQTLKLEDNSVETSADGGAAKLDDFFTESNSLLNGRLAYSRNATGLKDRAFNTLSFDGTEFNLSTALEEVTPTASGQPRDLLIVATATAATTISFTAGTIKGDKPTIDGSGTWLITLTEYASGVWYCRQIKMEDAA